MSWAPQTSEAPLDLLQILVRDRLAAVERERERIRAALDDAPEEQQRLVLARAEQALADPKLIGDAVIAAFFSADKARAREDARLRVRGFIEQAGTGWQERLKPVVGTLRGGTPSVVPFHWPLEFPEVFDRDNPGFDAIVGNPPFAGKTTITAVNQTNYIAWLTNIHPGSSGNADLAAHFYRRAFCLLREGGCFGLLATNTIRQGDTRASGLAPIRREGGTIYTARRRTKWPGEAAVVVCVVHIAKGQLPGPFRLDGRLVPLITAFLFQDGGDDDPQLLRANAKKSFQGSIILGMGFTFDDTDKSGAANPVKLMEELVQKDARNAERIFPYIGGEELNSSSTHAHHRWVIQFDELRGRPKMN